MRALQLGHLFAIAGVSLAVVGCTRLAGADSSAPASMLASPAATASPVAASPQASTSATGGVAFIAQQLLGQLHVSQPHGKVIAAAYVTTSYGALQATLPPESRLPVSSDTAAHGVIVLKAFGSFPAAHRGPIGANTDATTIVEVYDTTEGKLVETTYLTGPEPADLLGSSTASGPVEFADLRVLGSPVTLNP